jgi:hypothetical protein
MQRVSPFLEEHCPAIPGGMELRRQTPATGTTTPRTLPDDYEEPGAQWRRKKTEPPCPGQLAVEPLSGSHRCVSHIVNGFGNPGVDETW